ncbi:hypothetical protein HK407_05g09450 [Ordospora pajunii]|jgi:hypothetical protein|uniref:uncharacterized protein n=1 Tax=Ordospora pajunii TaxID=3039483 RepID=UPI0029526CDA|nr:uncharacterized protein HK407_05g09450 [Ordospora pajunii]KAH9411427.1 hypothetical protein HK407_05g09450 [Ordospora pajunii]
MEDRKKRKARDQLSPYSAPVDASEDEVPMMEAADALNRKRAKARMGGGMEIGDAEPLKGVLSSLSIFKPVVVNDKISGLNRCFVRAIQTVVETESNKDLSYLFRQYERYYEELSKANG